MISLATIKNISVWSTNPVKVGAVEQVVSYYTSNISCVWHKAPSGVWDMPLTVVETEIWAYNRAKRCLEHTDCDVAVWLEWWVSRESTVVGREVCYLFGIVCIVDSTGHIEFGHGAKYRLPDSIANELKNGAELWPIMDRIKNESDTKKWEWAIWFFSQGYIDRQAGFESTVVRAFIPWLRQDMYQ